MKPPLSALSHSQADRSPCHMVHPTVRYSTAFDPPIPMTLGKVSIYGEVILCTSLQLGMEIYANVYMHPSAQD